MCPLRARCWPFLDERRKASALSSPDGGACRQGEEVPSPLAPKVLMWDAQGLPFGPRTWHHRVKEAWVFMSSLSLAGCCDLRLVSQLF